MLRTLTATSRLVSSNSRILRLSSRMSLESTSNIAAAAANMSTSTYDPEAKLAELNYKLPTPSKSVANYVMSRRVGNMIYTGKFIMYRISIKEW